MVSNNPQATVNPATAGSPVVVTDFHGSTSSNPLPRRVGRLTPVLAFPVALVILAMTFGSVDIISPALPAVQDGLALSGTGAGLVVSLYFIGRLVMSIPAGMMVDRIGARWTTAIGAVVLLGGSLVCALATGEAMLLAGRTVQGVSLAMLLAAAMLSVVRARPGDGVAVTIMNVSAGIGSGCGLIASGLLVGAFGWEAVFWAVAVVSIAILGLTVAFSSATGRTTHPAGQLDPAIPESAPVPLAQLSVPIALNLIVQGGYGVFIVAMPLYAAWRFDAAPARIGALLITNTITHLICAVLTGRMIRRFGSARIVPVGLGFAVLGTIGILAVPADLLLIPPLALFAGGMVAANMSAADLLLQRGGRGPRAVSLCRLTTDISQVAGPLLVGVLIDAIGYPAPLAMLVAVLAFGLVLGRRQLTARS